MVEGLKKVCHVTSHVMSCDFLPSGGLSALSLFRLCEDRGRSKGRSAENI